MEGQMMKKDKIKVMIADDISSLVMKYEDILSQTEDIEVVATASDGYEAI